MTLEADSILFMFPPGGDEHLFRHHLGAAYIQAYLAKHGFSSSQFIPERGESLYACVDDVLAISAPIVGFTCYDTNYYLVRAIAERIKKLSPDTIVMIGGPTATFSDELVLEHTPDIDLCVRYEGEETTLELVSAISERGDIASLHEVRGITYRRNDSIVRTPPRPLFGSGNHSTGHLDGLPSPYLEGILDGTEGAGIQSARGCVHHCTYCNFSAMSRHTIRYFSIERIIAELKVIQSALQNDVAVPTLLQAVLIYDDAFTLNAKRAKAICRRIISEGIDLQFSGLCRADNLDDELVDLLRQAGFTRITFGLESAVPRILRNIRKVSSTHSHQGDHDLTLERIFLSRVENGIAMAKRHNMETSVSIILGLPGETVEDGLETMDFVRRLGVDSYVHNILSVFPGTELFDSAKQYGIEVSHSEFLLPYDTQIPYPVLDIPPLADSSVHERMRVKCRTILAAFAGKSSMWPRDGNGIACAVIYAADQPELHHPFDWLSSKLSMRGSVIVLGSDIASTVALKRLREANAASRLPTRDCFYLSKSSNGTRVVYRLLHEGVRSPSVEFPLIQLREYHSSWEDMRPRSSEIWPIYYLDDGQDTTALHALGTSTVPSTGRGRQDPYSLSDALILDACRWSRELCPAVGLKRIVVGEGGTVRACLSGRPIGTLHDDLNTLKKRVSEAFERTCTERGCETCPAETWCAKCIFPHPMSAHEYCELRRNYPGISAIIDRPGVGSPLPPAAQ